MYEIPKFPGRWKEIIQQKHENEAELGSPCCVPLDDAKSIVII